MKIMKKLSQLAAAAALATGLSLPASALTINFTNSSTQQVGTGYGNSVNYNIGSEFSMKAQAYSNTNRNRSLATAEIWKWGTGLGVCNRKESRVRRGCGFLGHQIDNLGSRDLIAFFFDQSVTFESVLIDPYGRRDRDISYWVGNVADGFSLRGTKYNQLRSVGFGGRIDKNSSRSRNPLSIGLTGSGNALLVSASLANGGDAFKLSSISIADPDLGGDVTPVPLPAAAWLMLSGLAAYGFTARKRKASV